jgi:hypothetical protein
VILELGQSISIEGLMSGLFAPEPEKDTNRFVTGNA